jgi:hypothetical protein
MGITTKTTKECTCDICQKSCQELDGNITIRVNNGDGRDVGPSTINGKIVFEQPYGVSNGLVCKACKKEFLTRYAASL